MRHELNERLDEGLSAPSVVQVKKAMRPPNQPLLASQIVVKILRAMDDLAQGAMTPLSGADISAKLWGLVNLLTP